VPLTFAKASVCWKFWSRTSSTVFSDK